MIRKSRPLLLLFWLMQGVLGPVKGSAQSTDRGWFRFRYDNDFFNATDRYYTQGIRLELTAPFTARSPLRHVLFGLGPGSSRSEILFAQQECFTPASIRRDAVLRTDRPFAAALYFGESSLSIDTERKRTLTSTLSLGILGPCAFCAEEQLAIHRALDNITPLGWEFQVSNAPLLNYGIALDQRLHRWRQFELSAGASVNLGTFRNNLGGHARAEAGLFDSLFDPRPTIISKWRLSAFLDGSFRAVVHDATFQGGPFGTDDPHTLPIAALKRVVLVGEGGIRVRFHQLGLSYSKTFITREFEEGTDHGWGTCRITAYF